MNESFIQADIFFFITSIAVVVVGLLFTVALIYFIKILRDIDKFQKRVNAGAGEVIEDIKVIRNELVNEGTGVIGIARTLFKFFGRTTRRIKKIKHHK